MTSLYYRMAGQGENCVFTQGKEIRVAVRRFYDIPLTTVVLLKKSTRIFHRHFVIYCLCVNSKVKYVKRTCVTMNLTIR